MEFGGFGPWAVKNRNYHPSSLYYSHLAKLTLVNTLEKLQNQSLNFQQLQKWSLLIKMLQTIQTYVIIHPTNKPNPKLIQHTPTLSAGPNHPKAQSTLINPLTPVFNINHPSQRPLLTLPFPTKTPPSPLVLLNHCNTPSPPPPPHFTHTLFPFQTNTSKTHLIPMKYSKLPPPAFSPISCQNGIQRS